MPDGAPNDATLDMDLVVNSYKGNDFADFRPSYMVSLIDFFNDKMAYVPSVCGYNRRTKVYIHTP